MRRFACGLAIASLLGCSFALAQGAAPPGGAEGTQAAPPPPPSSSESTAAPTTSPSTGEHAKHMSYKACSKQAHAKQLKGADRKQFIKDCEAGKSRG